MSTLYVPVVTFKLQKHPNADSLSLATIDNSDWICIVKTETFQNEIAGVYVPLDSVADKDHPLLAFMEGKKVKTIKLRGCISQGVLLPMSQVCQYLNSTLTSEEIKSIAEIKIGDNVAELLKIRKWEAPVNNNLGACDSIDQPEGFDQYTEIQNWKNYPNVIKEGELVSISEKLHGCLNFDSRILLADGSYEKIGKLVNNQYVGSIMGYKNGALVPTKVVNTFNNGITKEWLKIGIEIRRCGNGTSFSTIKCTPNHKIYSPVILNYVQADQLKIGDLVLSKHFDINLNPLQEQILLGKVLGDGCIRKTKTDRGNWHIEFSQKKEHEEYVDWCLKGLGTLAYKTGERLSGYGTKMVRAKTHSNFFIKRLFEDWLDLHDNKIVPESCITKIGPIALAFWYMDDGSLAHHKDQADRANFAICAFDGCQKVIEKIFNKFDITPTFYYSKNKTSKNKYIRILLNKREANKLFLLIAPYIPPCMQYKLPEKFKTNIALPYFENSYEDLLVEQKIISIEKIEPYNCTKYDLETETHNFFANGILVHNSNMRIGLIAGKLHLGSHRRTLQIDKNYVNRRGEVIELKPTAWHKVAEKLDLETKIRNISNFFEGKDVVVYGELYGKGVQDLTYGEAGYNFRVFDIKIGGQYLDPISCRNSAKELGLETVPVLYNGPFKKELLDLRFGRDFSDNHVREGIVIEPLEPRIDFSLGRVKLKVISEDYLIRKGGTDYEG